MISEIDETSPLFSVKLFQVHRIGSGLNIHAEYEFQITFETSTWTIYRRFSQILQFYKNLLVYLISTKNEEKDASLISSYTSIINTLKNNPLEKNNMGSYFSSYQYITKNRARDIQKLFTFLCKDTFIVNLGMFLSFIDFEGKGKLNISKEFQSELLCGQFLEYRLIPLNLSTYTSSNETSLNNFTQYFTYSSNFSKLYSVLLSDGRFFLLNSHNDNGGVARIKLRIKKNDGFTEIIGDMKANVIVLKNAKLDLLLTLKFDNVNDLTFWLSNFNDILEDRTEFSAPPRAFPPPPPISSIKLSLPPSTPPPSIPSSCEE